MFRHRQRLGVSQRAVHPPALDRFSGAPKLAQDALDLLIAKTKSQRFAQTAGGCNAIGMKLSRVAVG
jgi:hypothetical protein